MSEAEFHIQQAYDDVQRRRAAFNRDDEVCAEASAYGKCCDFLFDAWPAIYAELTALRQERDRLNERLENNYCIDSHGNRKSVPIGSIPDGIECRNETMRGYRGIIKALRQELAELKKQPEGMKLDENTIKMFIKCAERSDYGTRLHIDPTDLAYLAHDADLAASLARRVEELERYNAALKLFADFAMRIQEMSDEELEAWKQSALAAQPQPEGE